MSLRGDHHRLSLVRRAAGDPLARSHARSARHCLDAGAVRRAQDELAGPFVVEVDEAGVGAERVRDLLCDEREHLLEVERRVDGLDRLGEQPQVSLANVHAFDCRSREGVFPSA